MHHPFSHRASSPARAHLHERPPGSSCPLFTATIAAPVESPWLALALSSSGDDAEPETAQVLLPPHVSPDELPALIAFDDVRCAHAVTARSGSGLSQVVPRNSTKQELLEIAKNPAGHNSLPGSPLRNRGGGIRTRASLNATHALLN